MGHVGADGDAGGAREVVGHFRRGAGALLLQQGPAQLVQFPSGHAGLQGLAHGGEGPGDQPAHDTQFLEFVFAADGHGVTFGGAAVMPRIWVQYSSATSSSTISGPVTWP